MGSATTARSIAEFSCFIVQSGDSTNISLGAVRLVDMGLSWESALALLKRKGLQEFPLDKGNASSGNEIPVCSNTTLVCRYKANGRNLLASKEQLYFIK